MARVELKNDFHGTSATVDISSGVLSAAVVRRVRRALCCSGCECGDFMGMRGGAVTRNGDRVGFVQRPDGGADVVIY